MNKHLKCIDAYGTNGIPKLSSFVCHELDDALPRFTGVQWDSVRATHGVSAKANTSKAALGRGWTRPGFLVML
jgi:hypothetical protein